MKEYCPDLSKNGLTSRNRTSFALPAACAYYSSWVLLTRFLLRLTCDPHSFGTKNEKLDRFASSPALSVELVANLLQERAAKQKRGVPPVEEAKNEIGQPPSSPIEKQIRKVTIE